MQRVIKHTVTRLGTNEQNILKPEDSNLVSSYLLGSNSSFTDQESRLDVSFYKGESLYTNGEVEISETFIETFKDVKWYSILGVNKSKEAQQLAVDPVDACTSAGYGDSDTVVEYSSYDFLYYRGVTFYISEISSDRTEIRAKSLVLEDSDIREGATNLYNYLQEQAYSTKAYLDFEGVDQKVVVINDMLETIDGHAVLTLKLYEPLPLELGEKSTFEIILPLGDPVRFLVTVQESFIEDPPEQLRGPNYSVDLGTATISTDYLLYKDLLGSGKVFRPFQDNFRVSINHKDLGDFIHFSSAIERLENAKYKFELIWSYKVELKNPDISAGDRERYNTLIENIETNFDHYEVYLYEKNEPPYTWPKDRGGNLLDPTSEEVERWFNEAYERADYYDRQNPDILVETIPDTIRDTEESEPYVAFIHMIGQHFDDVWIYLKAIAEKYNGDNRLDFGISRDIVKQAIRDFGIDIYESNQNLNKLFELAQNEGITGKIGDELSVKKYITAPTNILNRQQQPIDKDTYDKELYKRIYHNLPALLKMKGTRRGLRVLLNCFGIPEEILDIKVAGGIEIEPTPYFGPQELINSGTIGLQDKVRTDSGSVVNVEDYVGNTRVDKALLSQDISIQNVVTKRSDDSHQVEIGFDLGKAENEYLKQQLPDFRFDDVFGDPRNKQQDYGDICRNIREKIMGEVDGHFRSPAAIIRLVRYFDVAVFRSLKDFLPARSTAAVGAIVKDNFLHRSRWQGVDVGWIDETYSGSMSTGAATGSTGGTMETPTTTAYTITLSNGIRYFTKDIDDESPKYNGELSGSYIEVTDGWLTENNPHNKSNPLKLNLRYNFRFMDLPEMPYCIVTAWDTTYKYHVFYINTKEAIGPVTNSDNVWYDRGERGTKYLAIANFTSSLQGNVSVSLEDLFPECDASSSKGFLGWYTGLNRPADNRIGVENARDPKWLQNSVNYDRLAPFGVPDKIQAVYGNVSRRLRLRVSHTESATYGYDSKKYLVILGSNLNNCKDSETFGTPGYLTILIEDSNGQEWQCTVSDTITYNTQEFTLKCDITGTSSLNTVRRFGFGTIGGGGYVGAYPIGTNQYNNADWFDNFTDWSGSLWNRTGSLDEAVAVTLRQYPPVE